MNQSFYLVAGMGKTGHSIAGYLTRRNLPFVFFDTRKESEALISLARDFPGVDIFFETLPSNIYRNLKAIIASPGIALDHVVFQEAAAYSLPVFGDLECLAQNLTAPVIAITGTNGKSTVTTLTGEMAKSAGLSVAVAGNIGTPVLDLLDNGQHYDLWVLELSSFQLDLIESLKPLAASILNISPDHLDRHGVYEAYIAAKQRIYKQAQSVFYNRDDALTYPAQTTQQQRVGSYGFDKASGNDWGIIEQNGKPYLAQGDVLLMAVDEMRLKGKHNWQNALAACALASAAGISKEHMRAVLHSFSGLPHRCQWVRTLDKVDWINDSKGTNIGATVSAIDGLGATLSGKIVLIAGGLGKGADFRELRSAVNRHLRSIVLIGTDAANIAEALADTVPIYFADSFDRAVLLAKEEAHADDVVLLSPACASQDMFRDFNHRGEEFVRLVQSL